MVFKLSGKGGGRGDLDAVKDLLCGNEEDEGCADAAADNEIGDEDDDCVLPGDLSSLDSERDLELLGGVLLPPPPSEESVDRLANAIPPPIMPRPIDRLRFIIDTSPLKPPP